MDEAKIKKLQAIKDLVDDDKAKAKDVAEAFGALLSVVRKMKQEMEKSMSEMHSEMSEDMKARMAKMDKEMSAMEAMCKKMKMSSECDMDMRKMADKLMGEIEDVKDMIPDMPDLTPVYSKIEEVKKSIPKETDLSEVTERIDELEEKLPKLEKRVATAAPRSVSVFGGRGFNLYTDGTKRGVANMLNIIPGTGITLSYSYANGRNDVTISASGSASLTPLEATGTIDDSNVTFTFASEPTLVVVNGASYRDGKGCTISGTSVTLDNPIGTGGDIYGL